MSIVISAKAAREATKTKTQVDQEEIERSLLWITDSIEHQCHHGYRTFTSIPHKWPFEVRKGLEKELSEAGYETKFMQDESTALFYRLHISWE